MSNLKTLRTLVEIGKASGNGKGGLKFSPGCLGSLGAGVLSGFAKIWHWLEAQPSGSTHPQPIFPRLSEFHQI